MIKEINATEFNSVIEQGVTLVKFGAAWCTACKAIHPALEELSEQIKNVRIVEIDADKNVEFVVGKGIKSLPTFGFYKNGEQISLDKGLNKTQIKDKLTDLI